MKDKERINELIAKLNQIAPVPDDDDPDLTPALVHEYCRVVDELYTIFTAEQVTAEDVWIIEPLLNSFSCGTVYGCAWSVKHILGRFSPEILQPFLRKHCKEGNRGARAWSAYMLGLLQDQDDVPLLIEMLQDSDYKVRREVLQALSVFKGDNIQKVMQIALDDPVEEVKRIAARYFF